MKSKLLLAMISAALLLVYPVASYAGPFGRGGYHQPSPPAKYHHSDHNSGSDVVPYLLGGLLVGGILAAVLSQSSYQAPAPAPTYTYSAPPAYGGQEPPGEWVTVPGRWVDGRWVPEHRVWVSVNP